MDNLRKEYANRIHQDVAGEGFYDKATKIKYLQRIFQTGDLPIHLKGKQDPRLYSGAMLVSVIGLGLTFGAVVMMATNTMPKKER